MEARYNIYFAGTVLDGHELSSVREQLARVFNANEETLGKLFSGQRQLLKRECDKATALKYKQAMENAGAEPIILLLQEQPTKPVGDGLSAAEKIAAVAVGSAPDDKPPAAPAQADDSGDIILAPSGTAVLREEERSAPLVRDVDTSGMEIDLQAEQLAPLAPAPPPAPDTSHLDMSAVGELIPNLESDLKPLSPNTDAIALAAKGTDFSDCAAPEPAAPALDLTGLEIAPTGEDVLQEQYRAKQDIPAPNTDHLSLDN